MKQIVPDPRKSSWELDTDSRHRAVQESGRQDLGAEDTCVRSTQQIVEDFLRLEPKAAMQ